jgi:hypothetical protein
MVLECLAFWEQWSTFKTAFPQTAIKRLTLLISFISEIKQVCMFINCLCNLRFEIE